MKGGCTMLPEKGYKRVIVICFYIALAVFLLFFVLKYLFQWVWPILVAAIIGIVVQPVVRFANKKIKLPKKVASIICVVLLYLVVGSLLYGIIYKVVMELVNFASTVPEYISKLNLDLSKAEEYFKDFLEKIHIDLNSETFATVWGSLSNWILSVIKDVSGDLTSGLASFVPKIVSLVPEIILAVVIMIVSSVYFAVDYDKLANFFKAQFKEETLAKITNGKKKFTQTIGKYFRAYILIMFITAVEIYLGLTIIGQEYALIIAIVVAIVDILPVLGTGTVFIPWGVILLCIGDVVKGIEILAIYLIITVIRQILEPKIIGEYIGLYPLVTLVAMYAGLRALGLLGMILFPLAVIFLKELNDNGTIHLWKNAPDMAAVKEKKPSLIEKIVNKLFKKKNK